MHGYFLSSIFHLHAFHWVIYALLSLSLYLPLALSRHSLRTDTYTHIRTLSHSFAEHSTKEKKKIDAKRCCHTNDQHSRTINNSLSYGTQFLPVQCCCLYDCYRAHTSIVYQSIVKNLLLLLRFCFGQLMFVYHTLDHKCNDNDKNSNISSK